MGPVHEMGYRSEDARCRLLMAGAKPTFVSAMLTVHEAAVSESRPLGTRNEHEASKAKR